MAEIVYDPTSGAICLDPEGKILACCEEATVDLCAPGRIQVDLAGVAEEGCPICPDDNASYLMQLAGLISSAGTCEAQSCGGLPSRCCVVSAQLAGAFFRCNASGADLLVWFGRVTPSRWIVQVVYSRQTLGVVGQVWRKTVDIQDLASLDVTLTFADTCQHQGPELFLNGDFLPQCNFENATVRVRRI